MTDTATPDETLYKLKGCHTDETVLQHLVPVMQPTPDETLYRYGSDPKQHGGDYLLLRDLIDRGVFVPVVQPTPDYEAAVEERHRYGRPKCYEGLDDAGCYCRDNVALVVAALGDTEMSEPVEMGVVRCHICGRKEGSGHAFDCTV
jgi:hypothetical protein